MALAGGGEVAGVCCKNSRQAPHRFAVKDMKSKGPSRWLVTLPLMHRDQAEAAHHAPKQMLPLQKSTLEASFPLATRNLADQGQAGDEHRVSPGFRNRGNREIERRVLRADEVSQFTGSGI